MELMKSIINQDLSDIKSIKDNLFLNCPNSKYTYSLSFNRRYPYKIDINCYNCQNKIDINLDDYLKALSNYDSQKVVKCEKHNTFLDKYCYKCHKQFCSQCDMNTHNNCYPIKQIMKVISKERLEEVQKTIELCKEDLEKYINTFMNDFLIKQPNDTHQFIIEGLVLPFIQQMKSFFKYCNYAILNYNIDFPDFYQQMNLKVILSIFKKKIYLIQLNENFEIIFNYQDNNYFSKHRVNLTFSPMIDNNNSIILDTFYFNKEIMVTYNNNGIKIIKNGECINTLSPKQKKINFYEINEDSFAIIAKAKQSSTVEIFSNKYNEIIFSKQFNNFYCFFNLEDNKTFCIGSSGAFDIYKIEDKNIQKEPAKFLQKHILDMIHIPNTKYIAVLGFKEIDLYNRDDLTLFKSIILSGAEQFNQFYQVNDGIIFLGGYKIGYFDINNWQVITIRDDGIKAFTSGAETRIDYSDIILTYFNRIICKKYFYQVTGSTYEDAPNTVKENEVSVCVLDFDTEKITSILIENKKGINPQSIYLNEKNEILISDSNGVQVYSVD